MCFLKKYRKSNSPVTDGFPEPYKTKLSGFACIVLMQLLHPSHTMVEVKKYVINSLGQEFVEPPPFDLEGVFQDSTPTTPIVFVLSTGADPMSALMKLGR